uniref:Superoxide dismutase copper/zinc binding domain-containing protein n=1 Tax=Poecilia mexicana TaxID=48701 RepID=A0A3B3XN77_9TELE
MNETKLYATEGSSVLYVIGWFTLQPEVTQFRFFLTSDSFSNVTHIRYVSDSNKEVRAVMNMRGISGYFNFRQASPFDVTQLSVNLANLRELFGPYHVHNFPVPSVRSGQCSNDNVGGHYNPFAVDTTSETYPVGPGSTHDKYETGDLGGKHMSLSGRSTFQMTFTDFSLPLFGQNSIVGRSVVIHLVSGDTYTGNGGSSANRARIDDRVASCGVGFLWRI